jgi:cytochrome P450
VRPPEQAIPPGLRGRRFGALFGQWLRMRDDAAREAEKLALQAALASLDATALAQAAQQQARQALSSSWSLWQWACLPCTVAALLGLSLPSTQDQQRLLAHLAALALALKPAAQEADLTEADRTLQALITELANAAPGPLALALQAQGLPPRSDTPWWMVQALALLWQSYEAGAGLLGQGLLWAAEKPLPAPASVHACLALLSAPKPDAGAIHHTRRFALRDCELAGQALRQGAPVLILLADSDLQAAASLRFGFGRHRCPAEAMALNIGAQALALALHRAQRTPLPTCRDYEALPNARVPKLSDAR